MAKQGSDEMEELLYSTPPELLAAAAEATKKLIPDKSKANYENAYIAFKKWKKSKNTDSSSETVLMAYFNELSKKYSPTSLWSFYSMLKKMISLHEKVNIEEYNQLTAFLKVNMKGFQSKKSKVFNPEEIQRFLSEAPDREYLATKVNIQLNL